MWLLYDYSASRTQAKLLSFWKIICKTVQQKSRMIILHDTLNRKQKAQLDAFTWPQLRVHNSEATIMPSSLQVVHLFSRNFDKRFWNEENPSIASCGICSVKGGRTLCPAFRSFPVADGSASAGCCLLSFSMMYEKVPKARQLWIRVCGAPATDEQNIRNYGDQYSYKGESAFIYFCRRGGERAAVTPVPLPTISKK